MVIGDIDIGNTFTLATFIKMDAGEIVRIKKSANWECCHRGNVAGFQFQFSIGEAA